MKLRVSLQYPLLALSSVLLVLVKHAVLWRNSTNAAVYYLKWELRLTFGNLGHFFLLFRCCSGFGLGFVFGVGLLLTFLLLAVLLVLLMLLALLRLVVFTALACCCKCSKHFACSRYFLILYFALFRSFLLSRPIAKRCLLLFLLLSVQH